jgi:pyruvate dehydrogenase E2 component (dihydrolipoamide acetyltransferase)
MASVFNFPDVGEGIHEGRVVEWLVAEGDSVVEDQPLLKVETDKAVVELPSPYAGVVLRLHAAAAAEIHVGDPLVTVGEAGESVADSTAVPEPTEAAAAGAETAPVEAVAPPPPARRPLATPRTRALARRLGVDLAAVTGTGSGGRITDEDVERAAASSQTAAPSPQPTPPRPAAAAPSPPAAAAGERVERVPLTHLRKVIAGAMRASKDAAAHVTHVDEADVTELVATYRKLKPRIEQQWDVRFTLLPFFVKALVAVLKDYPAFNASVDEERGELLLKHYYNIGVAVDTPEGLIVPVLKDADGKDMVAIAREVGDLAERARERRLGLDELRDGTCTLTNIGPLGGVFATPIINQPELAIVGLHKISERPAVIDGEIVARRMMYLSVSFDHRYIDGADAARFMSDLVRLVEEPGLLMARL